MPSPSSSCSRPAGLDLVPTLDQQRQDRAGERDDRRDEHGFVEAVEEREVRRLGDGDQQRGGTGGTIPCETA